MARRLKSLKRKRSLGGVLEFLSKSVNRICFGMIACSFSRLVYLMNPEELNRLTNFTEAFIWGWVIILIISNIGLNFKEEDAGCKVLQVELERTKKCLIESLILIIVTLLIRPIASQALYIGMSHACIFSTTCIVIAYGFSKQNAKYFRNTSA